MTTFTAHNIRLSDGQYTKPEAGIGIEQHPWFLSARRIMNVIFPGDKSGLRLADVGCLEGGYSVQFARMGFDVLGMDIRDENIAACNFVKERSGLTNLRFVKDDVWNLHDYGVFDAIFCCGLLYHVDKPKALLGLLGRSCRKALLLNTHFSTGDFRIRSRYKLSKISVNEGLSGRWYSEPEDRQNSRWASWSNSRSFWIQKEHLLGAIKDAGFGIVLEQFDHLPDIPGSLNSVYKIEHRGIFVGIKP